MAAVAFDRVTKVYDDSTLAVDDVSLDIGDGELVVLVGPSGCGKTSALRMVAGLEEISAGEIRIGDRIVNELAPRERDIAMVFQNYALYPHMTVFQNIAFGLRMRGVPKDEQRRAVERAAQLLGLTEYLEKRPRHLSGGQRQRVAMGRAIVREPKAFLMDEPLSNLDAKLRVQMRAEISRIQRELAVTTLYVTHDQVEAMTMGDRVAVLRRGILQQFAPPQRLYEAPANLFVASFIGSPAMNLFEAELAERNGSLFARLSDVDIELSGRPAVQKRAGERVALGIRPEHLHISADEGLPAVVLLTEALGPELLVHAEVSAKPVVRDDVIEGAVEDASTADLLQRSTVVARLDPNVHVSVGEHIHLAPDPERVHVFDLTTSEALDTPPRRPAAAVTP